MSTVRLSRWVAPFADVNDGSLGCSAATMICAGLQVQFYLSSMWQVITRREFARTVAAAAQARMREAP